VACKQGTGRVGGDEGRASDRSSEFTRGLVAGSLHLASLMLSVVYIPEAWRGTFNPPAGLVFCCCCCWSMSVGPVARPASRAVWNSCCLCKSSAVLVRMWPGGSKDANRKPAPASKHHQPDNLHNFKLLEVNAGSTQPW